MTTRVPAHGIAGFWRNSLRRVSPSCHRFPSARAMVIIRTCSSSIERSTTVACGPSVNRTHESAAHTVAVSTALPGSSFHPPTIFRCFELDRDIQQLQAGHANATVAHPSQKEASHADAHRCKDGGIENVEPYPEAGPRLRRSQGRTRGSHYSKPSRGTSSSRTPAKPSSCWKRALL
jgi:hypothetical protein